MRDDTGPPDFDLLAECIKEDLLAAGLPLAAGHGLTGDAGVRIEIDPQLGVYLGWACHHVLTSVSSEEDARLQDDGPATRFQGSVDLAMRDAIARVLKAAGYRLTKDVGYSPHTLLVQGGWPVSPSWRDRHEQRRRRLLAVRYRLREARRAAGA